MMESTIINNIISINKEINIEYRTSKKPEFIKTLIAKRRRNKLKKIIETIKSYVYLPSKLLAEYIREINANYGKHQHCINIGYVSDNSHLLMANFRVRIQEYDLFVTVGPEKEDNSSFIIRYLYSKDGQTIFSFTDENITFLEDNKRYENEEYPYKSHIVNDVLRDIFAKTVIEDIYKYLMDTIKRSERIGEK